MRIGVHCFPLKPDLAGAKQYFLSLFDELLAYDAENQYVFFHGEKNIPELAELASPVWHRNAVALERTGRLHHQLEGIDLYFSPFGVIAPRPLALPTVVTLADIPEVAFPQLFPREHHYRREWHFRGSAKMADKVLTFSKHSKTSIAKCYGVNRERIRVIRPCADRTYYKAQELGRRPAEFGCPGEFILFPASNSKHKNHRALMQALRLLGNKGLDLVLTGPELRHGENLRELASELGSRVHILGCLQREELAWLYSHAQLTVLPSLDSGFTLPMLEAMAAGCPVAASRAGAFQEIGSDAALYFDPENVEEIAASVQRLCQSDDLRQQLVKRGRKRASHFSPEKLVSGHQRAFREAVRSFNLARYIWHAALVRPVQAQLIGRKYRGVRRKEA